MKIIQVIPFLGMGGAEIMCENLTYELVKLGHDVTVVSMYDCHSAITDRLESFGVDVRYLGKKSGFDLSMIPKMKRIYKETSAEVLHTHLYCTKYAIPAAVFAGVKQRVHTVHNIAEKENKKSGRKLNKFFFKHCRLIPVALSELIRDSIVKEYGIEKNKIPVILNGIDLSKCIPKDNYAVLGNFRILHIGRFSEQKNHIGLLEAFRLFCSKHSDSELWLIGDGDKKAKIEKFVQENGLEANVKFLGVQNNVYGYLHDADIFTLPSNYEGIPMTLIEAMGTGLPIVATAVGGVPDMLDGDSAILTAVDTKEIADAFEKYFSDETLRLQHGTNARKRSVAFSAAKMAEDYKAVYSHKGNDR